MTCSKVPELSKGAHAYTTIAGDSFVNGVVAMTDIVFAFAGRMISSLQTLVPRTLLLFKQAP